MSAVTVDGPQWGQAEATEPVLRALRPWFGIEEATREYVRQTNERPTWLARAAGGEVIGFSTIATHYPQAWEILVMGVHPDWHRRGVGRALVEAVEGYARDRGVAFLQVKTLSPEHPDAGYAMTRSFYYGRGFLEVEVFKTLWDPVNPAMMLVKTLRSGGPEQPIVRWARPRDAAGIRRIHREAFESDAEALLVDALVAEGLDRLSLVAVAEEATGRPGVVGHVLFSELRVECDERSEPGLALAPLAVRPDDQRRGIGATLTRAGLFAARERGHERVVVVGDPDYYGRFGFSAELASGLTSVYAGPALQALELVEGAFDGLGSASLRYPEPFAEV